MGASVDHVENRELSFGVVATAVLDADGTILRWSRAAAELLGRTAVEACGHPASRLLADASECRAEGSGIAIPATGRAWLRHRSGSPLDVTFRVMPLEDSSELLVLAAPTPCVTEQEQSASVLRSLLSQDRAGVTLYDTDLTIVRTNVTPEVFGVPLPAGIRLGEALPAEDAAEVEAALRQVLKTGVPLLGSAQRMRSPLSPGRERALSFSAFRLEDARGQPTGVVTLSSGITEQQHRARRHLDLLHQAATRIGGSLDVIRTAQNLADVLVPAFGDVAWVELAEAVLDGDEPPKMLGGGKQHWRRSAAACIPGTWSAGLLEHGGTVPQLPDMPHLRGIQLGRITLIDRKTLIAEFGDPHLTELFVPPDGRWFMCSPLFARGLVLGAVAVWRTGGREPFDEEDVNRLAEVASRAALSVDNARRYTREHRAAVALQQRLLPRATTDTPAAQTAGFYQPAGGGAGLGGDWFDVIPLPSLRVALVVGDVVGHGLHATATMGRLRTAVQTLAALELDPAELLTRVEDLVQCLEAEAPLGQRDAIGATCLYAVHDPVARRCTLVSAGHPPPILIRPDGTTQLIEISPGPPLGVGGMPPEVTTLDLEPDSVLALYTDGLIERDGLDINGGLRWLTDNLAALTGPGRALGHIGDALFARLGNRPPRDDIALLLARTRAIAPENTASWEFPADPAVVSNVRDATARQLAAWSLNDLAFTTELIVSELVTNAIRYSGGPVGLRLIRESVLVCEVTDPSNTQPRLRRARWSDEGGRGLFLVSQLTTRWGSRYGQQGKTIWAEQPLTAAR